MLLILVGVFVLFFVLKTQVANAGATYANVECENTASEYGSDENLKKFAFYEYYQKYEIKNIDRLSGALQCWCKQYKEENGYVDTYNY